MWLLSTTTFETPCPCPSSNITDRMMDFRKSCGLIFSSHQFNERRNWTSVVLQFFGKAKYWIFLVKGPVYSWGFRQFNEENPSHYAVACIGSFLVRLLLGESTWSVLRPINLMKGVMDHHNNGCRTMTFIGVNRENAHGVFRFPANLMIGKNDSWWTKDHPINLMRESWDNLLVWFAFL